MFNEKNTSWVDSIITQLLSGKRYKRLIQKCLDNMDGNQKKLYKYYSFNSEYTFSNIENSHVFYSNPVTFNDPFDCNIGISINQFFKILPPNVLPMFDQNLNKDEKKILESLIFGNSETEIDDGSKEAFLAECMEVPEFNNLMNRITSGEKVSDTEFTEVFTSSPIILTSLLKYGLDGDFDFSNIDISKLIGIICGSSQLLKTFMLSYSITQNDDTSKILKLFANDDDFLRKIANFAKQFGQEIPEEEINEIYNQFDSLIKEMHRGVGEAIGVSCFTEKPDNMLMWSHYADKHTGICVEYDFSKMFSSVPNSMLFPVSYSKQRPVLPIEKVCKIDDGKFTNDNNSLEVLLPDILKSLVIKSSIWNYEKEWRHIVFTSDMKNRVVCLPIISAIIIGINISPENEKKIVEIAKRKQIPLYKAKLRPDKYEMIVTEYKEI